MHRPRAVTAVLLLGAAAVVHAGLRPYQPTPAEVLASYRSADTLQRLSDDASFNTSLAINWLGNDRLWYVRTAPGRKREHILVEVATGSKRPLFDARKLVEALEAAGGPTLDPDRLNLEGLRANQEADEIRFRAGDKAWLFRPTRGTLEEDKPTPEAPRPPRTDDGWNRSPDGKRAAQLRTGTVWIREGEETPQRIGEATGLTRLEWSPNGRHLAAWKLNPGDRRLTHLLASTVAGFRAALRSRMYDLPGDKLDTYELYLYDAESRSERKVEIEPIMGGGQPWSGPPGIEWIAGGSSLLLEFPVRGYQRARIVRVDAADGKTTDVVDERSPTFIHLSQMISQTIAGGREVLWRSERDGWGHLYRFRTEDGSLVNQVTKGSFVVRSVERIDEQSGWVWFLANGVGVDPAKEDPYFTKLFRARLDGSKMEPLTPANGHHRIQWSPNRTAFVATASRVDQPPVHELRRDDGTLVVTLEKADVAAMLKRGYRTPEPFVAMGRDGKTPIWGIVVRPTNFDPRRAYPVVETIYAGPHDSHVPKAWIGVSGMHRLAELGFIVVMIDGMGTANRGKAFHDVAWKNVADAGFPDRIAWLKALHAKYPYVDIGRVGIEGTSAGGQNAAGAVLWHPDFYKVAVASCGCHDNRMDKQWWNEQWMGYPVGPHYAEQSNITQAARLRGRLLLMVGEVDDNVPPESTYRFADALIRAGKEFELVVLPGQGHTGGGVYGERKRRDFFVRHLHGVPTPNWNEPPKQ